MATFHARQSRPGVATYLYEFNQPAAHRDAYPRWPTGTPGDELMYVLGAPLADQSLEPFPARVYSRAERLLSQRVVRYWSNFAKTGSVNILSTDSSVAARHNGSVDVNSEFKAQYTPPTPMRRGATRHLSRVTRVVVGGVYWASYSTISCMISVALSSLH